MKYLCAIVLLFLLSGCSDGVADSDDLSDLKLYVEEVKSRKPLEDPFGEGYIPTSPPLPVFTPNDNPFDQGHPSLGREPTNPTAKGADSRSAKMRTLLLLVFLLGSISAFAQAVYQGKVIKITDGDTLTILVDKQQLKIRLSDIDTPERKQPFGTKAKQALSELAFGKHARVVEWTIEQDFPGFGRGFESGVEHLSGGHGDQVSTLADRDGWIVGRVYVDGMDVNRELVAQGYAWLYKYSNDAELLELEAEAKQKGLGLWADPNPIPP